MGILDGLIGYSDKKTEEVVHYLRITAMPGVKGSRTFFETCAFSDIETSRFVFCSLILNLSATLAIVNSKYKSKFLQITRKLFNAYNMRLERSPNNLSITDFVVYQPELESILEREEISIHHTTNEYSIFNMVWPDRSSFYYRHIRRMPGIVKRTNIIFEDELDLFDFDPSNIDHEKEILDHFLLHFTGQKSNQVSISSSVWEHLHKNLVALKNYA